MGEASLWRIFYVLSRSEQEITVLLGVGLPHALSMACFSMFVV